jgi:hypothetical protein
MRRVLPALALAAVATGAVIVTPAASVPPPPVTFGVPRIADPIHVYGEPDIAVGPTGSVHVSGPQGTGVQRSVWNLSADGGDTFRVVDDVRFNDGAAYSCDVTFCPSKSTLGPGGGDTEIYVTRDNQAFYNDLWALTCFAAATTKDEGKTVASRADGCSQDGLANADRQWMAAYDPAPSDRTVSPYQGPTPVVYMAYNGPQVDMTTDGLDYTTSAGQYKGNTGANWIVDQHTGDVMTVTHTGRILQLAIGEPDEAGKLTFDYNEATDERPNSPGLLFPTISQDTDRNVYIVWTEDTSYQVFYTWASASDGWTKWAPVRQISKPPARVNVFSWSTSGGPGMLDVAWYGTPDEVASPDDQEHQTWFLYFAQVDHANTTKPHMVQVQASPHPMHYDDICLAGTGCVASVGNRNLADFFKIVLDNDGRARIVYADTSNRLMEVETEEGADHAGAPVDTVVTQSTGLDAWTGKPLAPLESTDPVGGVTDPAGDALWQPLGGEPMGAADITQATLSKDGDNLVVKVALKEGRLSDVAAAATAAAAQLVVRWQVAGTPTEGDPIYYAQVEELTGSPTPEFTAGPARTVDLCSVSACKPNYVVYPSTPDPTSGVTGEFADQTYTITVPLSLVGDPSDDTVLEEVSVHVAAEPVSSNAPPTKVEKFVDEVPVVVDATRTWNYTLGATGLGAPMPVFPAVQRDGCSVGGSTGGTAAGNDGSLGACNVAGPRRPGKGSGSGGGSGGGNGGGSGRGEAGGDDLATTGLDPVLPAGALLATAAFLTVRRRRRRAA